MQRAYVLATLTIAALCAADGVTHLLAARLVRAVETPRASASSAPSPAPPAVADGGPDAARAVLARNIFDPETGALWPPRAPEEPEPPAPAPPDPNARCDIGLRVAAAFYDQREPDRSWVVLRGGSAGDGQTVTRGMSIGDQVVGWIEPEAVRLFGPGDRACWLAMFTPHSRAKIEREQAAQNDRSARKRKRSKEPPFSPAELQAGIRPLGDNRYAIRRHVVEKARAHSEYLSATTRIARARGKGVGPGMRIAKLRKGGLLASLGLQRGDVVRSINGVAATDTGSVLEAYARLDRTNHISLAITRDRESLVLEYYVQ